MGKSNNPSSTADMIGSPDLVSGIRPVKYHIPANETDTERQWREQRERVDQGHHNFWYNNNKQFKAKQQQFIQQFTKDNGVAPTDEEMTTFYRQFLLDNKAQHRQYQQWWLRENVALLVSELRQYLQRSGIMAKPPPTTTTNTHRPSNK
ncbi:hypothetical protein BDF19DRAFT_98393 [Syncephalis fuscata]|nr:hypothetical protein BDF19DRAFT_98393 [Syncephalis fuscata]